MLKHHYKVLKYIHKHEPINKADLLKKFPDFDDCLNDISDYLCIKDNNQAIEQGLNTKLSIDASKVCKNVSEMSEYISSHREEIPYDECIVFYSTKISFVELLEEKQIEFRKSLLKLTASFLKFIITYVLGIVSGLIIAYLTNKFNW